MSQNDVINFSPFLPSLSELHTPASGRPGTVAGGGRCPAGCPQWRPGPTQKASTSKTGNQQEDPPPLEPFRKEGEGDAPSQGRATHRRRRGAHTANLPESGRGSTLDRMCYWCPQLTDEWQGGDWGPPHHSFCGVICELIQNALPNCSPSRWHRQVLWWATSWQQKSVYLHLCVLIVHKKHSWSDSIFVRWSYFYRLGIWSSFEYFNVMGNQKHPRAVNKTSMSKRHVWSSYVLYAFLASHLGVKKKKLCITI